MYSTRQKVSIGGGLVVLIVAALWLGWWQLGTSGGSATAVRTHSDDSSSPVVTLTNSSQGHTVTAPVGEEIVVALTGVPLHWSEAWAVPGSAGTGPVLTLVKASTSSNGSSITRYRVTGVGTVSIRASGTPICHTDAACPQFVVLWQASVTGVRSTPTVVASTKG